jgi:hypothetical protein
MLYISADFASLEYIHRYRRSGELTLDTGRGNGNVTEIEKVVQELLEGHRKVFDDRGQAVEATFLETAAGLRNAIHLAQGNARGYVVNVVTQVVRNVVSYPQN